MSAKGGKAWLLQSKAAESRFVDWPHKQQAKVQAAEKQMPLNGRESR